MRLKILQIIFSLVIGLMAGSAQSIGLGKLSANSVLGEPLHITIPLLSVSPAQLEELTVGLASAAVYATLDWPYPQTAGEMKFEVESYTEGEATIFVTTESHISQTILPLVIQVTWPGGGQLQRDFMVLLDPPEYVIALSEANIPVSGSVAVEVSDEITTTALEIPDTTEVTAIPEPADPAPSESVSSSPAATNSRVDQAKKNGGFVDVIRGDSLSKIAEMFLQQGATKYQVRVAFYDANPQAFVDGNINLLKNGHRLTVPSAEKIRSYSRNVAKQRYTDLVNSPVELASTAEPESQPAMEASAPESQGGDAAATETPESASVAKETIEPESAEVVSEDAANSEDTADSEPQTTAETEEFGLRVLPVESEVIASSESQEAPENNQASEPQQTQDELLDTFSMQGFSTRIRYMDAYLLELQDENQLLKDKIDSLEQTVGLLVNFVPVEGLSPEQQAALKILREDFPVGNNSGNGFEEDTGAESTAQTELAAISTSEETATEEPDQPDTQSLMTETDLSSSQTLENGGAVELKETATGEVAMANANPVQTEPESTATTVNTDGDNNTAQPETGSRRVKITNDWSTQIQKLLNNQYFLPGVAFLVIAGLLYRRKRIRDEAEVNERLKMDPQINTQGEASIAGDSQPSPPKYIRGAKPGQGVTYLEPDEQDNTFLSDDIFTSEETQGNQESNKTEITPEVIDIPQDHKLDSITEADVFMKYDRPDLAIQVLEDEYRNDTGNQGLIALKLIDVHESLSGKTDTDSSFKSLIQRLYSDMDKFDSDTWQKISERIDKSEIS
jgi:FimV-like protein